LLAGKNNLAAEGTGLAFRIIGNPVTIEWEREPVTMSADDAFEAENTPETPGPKPTVRNAAAEYLLQLLADGIEHSVAEIRQQAAAKGFKWRTVENAAGEIGVIRRPVAVGQPGYWKLPAPVKIAHQT